MEANIPVWAYYQPGYIHPEFVPYNNVPMTDDKGNPVRVNPWKKEGDMLRVNPALIRKNWGNSFMLKHPDDPCPSGYIKDYNTGWCTPEQPEWEPTFYTDKAFLPKNQYWNSYTQHNWGKRRVSQPTDLRSVNPISGEYVVYYQPLPHVDETRYGIITGKDSYLG